MLLIRFTDARGTEWEVWEVGARPAPADLRPSGAAREGRLPERWLCFASATERRRLLRYPDRWHALPPAELEALCHSASPARPVSAPAPADTPAPSPAPRVG